MLNNQSAILLYESMIFDLESDITIDHQSLNLRHKQSSNQTSEIHAQYDLEEDQIRNQINEAKDADDMSEYQSLMTDLKELEDKEDALVKKIEEDMTIQENKIQTRIESDEIKVEDAKAERDALKETLKDNIKTSFSYAQ